MFFNLTSSHMWWGVISGGHGIGWLSSEAARGSASTWVSENKPFFSSTVICHAPAISRINWQTVTTMQTLIRCPQVEMKPEEIEKMIVYRYFHSNTSCQQPLPASDGSFHAVCCEHLERRPAEVVQELWITLWSPQKRKVTAHPQIQHLTACLCWNIIRHRGQLHLCCWWATRPVWTWPRWKPQAGQTLKLLPSAWSSAGQDQRAHGPPEQSGSYQIPADKGGIRWIMNKPQINHNHSWSDLTVLPRQRIGSWGWGKPWS